MYTLGGNASKTKVDRRKNSFEKDAVIHMNDLQHMACRLTQNTRDAEDLVQEVMLKALKNFHRFEKGTNCKAWLYTILKNTFINDYRKTARRPRNVELFDGLGSRTRRHSLAVAKEDITSENSWFGEMLEDDVKHALDNLPSEFRNVLLMNIIEGLSYKEIAQTMGMPLGTVMSRLYRGRAMLRKSLHNFALREGIIRK